MGSRGSVRRYGISVGLMVAVAIVVVVFLVGFLILLWHTDWLEFGGLRGLSPDQRVTAIDATRGRLIQVGAGILAAGALVFTALNFWLSREGHVTDRYTKAIEQLGSERLDVRLGAIYALERIMIDSPRDHATIVEVLAAFVREHTTRLVSDAEERSRTLRQLRSFVDDEDISQAEAIPAVPRTDVQAAITVLGRRPRGRAERGRLDLRGAYLAGVNLEEADFSSADMSKADLTRASLYHARLSGAILRQAVLTGASMRYADLTDAQLSAANLDEADLLGAKLTHANFSRVSVEKTTLFRDALAGLYKQGMTGEPHYFDGVIRKYRPR